MQVNDIDSSDTSMAQATSQGYLRYPPPAVVVTNSQSNDRVSLAAELPLMSLSLLFVPSFSMDDSRVDMQHSNRNASVSNMEVDSAASVQLQTNANVENQQHIAVSRPVISSVSHQVLENNSYRHGVETGASDPRVDAMDMDERQPAGQSELAASSNLESVGIAMRGTPAEMSSRPPGGVEVGQLQQFFPFRDPACWELPFLQGWLMGQSQVGVHSMLTLNGSGRDHSVQHFDTSSTSQQATYNSEASAASLVVPGSINISGMLGRSGQNQIPHSRILLSEAGDAAATSGTLHDGTDSQPIISRIQSELATSLAAAAAAELPCTVKLKVWAHDIKNPCAPLSVERCRLMIPHAVLCR